MPRSCLSTRRAAPRRGSPRCRSAAPRRPQRGARRARRSASSASTAGTRGVQRPIGWTRRPADRRAPRVAVRPRHPLVDLGDQDPRGQGRGQRGVDRRAERAVSVAVGRGQLQQRDVERDRARHEQARDVRQEDRHEVGAALRDRVAERRPGEQRQRAKPAGVLRRRERRRTARVQVIEADVAQVRPSRQGFKKRSGRRRGAVDEDAHAARGERERVISRDGAFHQFRHTDDCIAWLALTRRQACLLSTENLECGEGQGPRATCHVLLAHVLRVTCHVLECSGGQDPT